MLFDIDLPMREQTAAILTSRNWLHSLTILGNPPFRHNLLTDCSVVSFSRAGPLIQFASSLAFDVGPRTHRAGAEPKCAPSRPKFDLEARSAAPSSRLKKALPAVNHIVGIVILDL